MHQLPDLLSALTALLAHTQGLAVLQRATRVVQGLQHLQQDL